MEKQQINLYKSIPRISRNWFNEMVVLQVAAGFLALLVLITVVQMMMLQYSQHSVSKLQKNYIDLNAHFVKEKNTQGAVDLLQLQQELASKKQLLSLLHIKSEDGGACPLLSDYFKSLSQVQVPGIWLTHIRIEPGTQNMTFEGETYDPVLIVNFIKQMGMTPCFTGMKFHTITIEKNANPENKAMFFSIASVSTPSKLVGGK